MLILYTKVIGPPGRCYSGSITNPQEFPLLNGAVLAPDDEFVAEGTGFSMPAPIGKESGR
jgi:hypothetical protein